MEAKQRFRDTFYGKLPSAGGKRGQVEGVNRGRAGGLESTNMVNALNCLNLNCKGLFCS